MASFADSMRIDTLLALALNFDRDDSGATMPAGDEAGEASSSNTCVEQLLSVLGEADRQAAQRRAHWYKKLEPHKQSQWLGHTLGRIGAETAQLDEHVHPSHIVEVLREEPPRVQETVLRNLRPVLAVTCAAALHVERQNHFQPAPSANPNASSAGSQTRRDASGEAMPLPEINTLVRRTFLSHFVSASDLYHPTDFDLLLDVEVARLVRVLGVRETAVACRGIEQMDDIGSFLRRFAAEDARAIATHLSRLTEIEQPRVAFAHGLVQEALSLSDEPEAMLDHLGLRLLAIVLTKRDKVCVAYTTQKLPLLAARAIYEMVADSENRFDPQIVRQLARETETIAHSLRRNRRPIHRQAATRPGDQSAPRNIEE